MNMEIFFTWMDFSQVGEVAILNMSHMAYYIIIIRLKQHTFKLSLENIF